MCALRMLRSSQSSEVMRSGAGTPPDDPLQPSLDLEAAPGPRRSNSDAVAIQAHELARKLDDISGVLANPLDDTDAASVNAAISVVAEGADQFISKLVDDAEANGLEATGDWMKIPLVEQREFEVPEPDPEAYRADDEHDRKLNS